MAWQLVQVSAVKFSSASTVSILPAWQATQLALFCGYGNSIMCDMCVSFMTFAVYAYLTGSGATFVAQASGSSTICCHSKWPPARVS